MADKPKFDPTQPFEAAADSKPKFDPSQPFHAADAPEAAPAAPEGWGHYLSRQALSMLPVAGGIAGGVAGAPEGGVGAIPAAALGYAGGKQLQRLGERYLLGDQQAPQSVGGQVKQVAGDLGEGALAEVGGQAAGAVMSPVAKAIADRLRATGIGAAIQHLRPTPRVAQAIGPEGLNAIGEQAITSGAIKPLQRVGSTAERLGGMKQEAGQQLGNIVDNSPAMVGRGDVAEAVQNNVINPLQATTAGKRIAEPVQGKLDALTADLGDEPVPISRLEAEKRMEQGSNNYLTQSNAAKTADKGYASQLRQVVEDAIGQQDPQSLPAFLQAKQNYGKLSQASKMADRSAALTDGGTGLMGHIGDVGAMAAGASSTLAGNPAGLALPLGRAITKGRVSSTVATGAYGAGNAIQAYGSPVAKAIAMRATGAIPRGGEAGAAVSTPEESRQGLIDQQTNPSAQQALKDLQEK